MKTEEMKETLTQMLKDWEAATPEQRSKASKEAAVLANEISLREGKYFPGMIR